MKKLLFILTISIFLLSCEKNYSCVCRTRMIDIYTDTVYQEFIFAPWEKETTKNKAKNECDNSDDDYTDGSIRYVTDCNITKF